MTDIFKKVIILSDFDGTFYDGRMQKSPEINIEKIEYFKTNGGHFSFSSGRFPKVLDVLYPKYREIVNAPLIMGNGSLLYNIDDDSIHAEHFIDGHLANEVLSFGKNVMGDKTIRTAVYTSDGVLNENPDNGILSSPEFYKLWFITGDVDSALELRDELIKKFGDKCNVFRSADSMVEIVDKTASKAIQLDNVKRFLSKKVGVDKNDLIVCAIGDFENDIPLLSVADYAFCPSNAIDEVKNICDYVLCDCSQGAVAQMIDVIEKEIR